MQRGGMDGSTIPSQAGKLAVVTAATASIGWQTALELARPGPDRSELSGSRASIFLA
jgi:hypothetical protein